MILRSTIAGIAVVLVAAWGITGLARQGASQTEPKVAALVAALSSPDESIREQAATALGSVKSDQSVAALIGAVTRETGRVQRAAAASLGAIGDPRAIEPLAGALKGSPWYVREEAARALGRIRSNAAIKPLVAALGDGNGQVRQSAGAALVAHGEAAVQAVAVALDAPGDVVRWQAAWVLGHVEAPGVVELLLGALERGDPMVRLESAVGLARIGTGSDALAGGLARLLTNRDPAVREDAAWVLGKLGSPRAAAPLVATLSDPEAGWMAATALGVLGAPSAATPLAGALESTSARTRRAAAWAMNRLRATGSIPVLRRALDDADPEVRYWAAEALRGIGTAEAARAGAAARPTRWDREARRCAPPRSSAVIKSGTVTDGGRSYRLYPETLDARPDIPSPLTAADGTELVVAITWNNKYGIVPVTLEAKSRQCDADGDDFPTLARTGLHSEVELDRTRTIMGRSVGEIADLGRPGRLSDDGFLSVGEDIVSILQADNRIVTALGLTHPDLARPLFHIINMMQTDIDLGRWNMAEHRWRNITAVLSHGRTVKLVAGDSKGGQLSIFADGIEGSSWVEITGDLTAQERAFLKKRYGRLDADAMDALVRSLTRIRTGEIQPHYVTWYGFHEGKTPWRTAPITIAFVFGLRTLEQIEAAFPGRLYEVMMARFAGAGPGAGQ